MSDDRKLWWLLLVLACPFAIFLMPDEEVDE